MHTICTSVLLFTTCFIFVQAALKKILSCAFLKPVTVLESTELGIRPVLTYRPLQLLGVWPWEVLNISVSVTGLLGGLKELLEASVRCILGPLSVSVLSSSYLWLLIPGGVMCFCFYVILSR